MEPSLKLSKIESCNYATEDSKDGIENYQISEQIGAGSFGKVYAAIDLRTGERGAIKKILELEYGLAELVREISIQQYLKHDNIMGIKDVIPVYHIDSTKNDMGLEALYIVLEYGDHDLRRLIQSDVYLTDDQIRKIMYQLLGGVKYIHSANIIHRDLKPGNLLINNDLSLKIGDFGLARSLIGIKDWDNMIQNYNVKKSNFADQPINEETKDDSSDISTPRESDEENDKVDIADDKQFQRSNSIEELK